MAAAKYTNNASLLVPNMAYFCLGHGGEDKGPMGAANRDQR